MNDKNHVTKIRTTRTQYSASNTPDASGLGALFDEAVALFHRLKAVAEEVYRKEELSAARRGVLRDLHRNGPQTVPQMARSRPVSRQHIQTLVDSLREQGYVESTPNPAHKRSHLLQLTSAGEDLVRLMARREARLLADLPIPVSPRELTLSRDVLRKVREFFEGSEWQEIVEKESNQE